MKKISLLTFFLALALLASCGTEQKTETQTVSSSSGQASATDTTESKEEGTVTESEEIVNSKMQETDFIINKALWQTPALRPEGFLFEIQGAGLEAEEAGIGEGATEYNSASGQERMARAEEWGYSLTHLDGITDGAGRVIDSNFTKEDAPADRNDAIQKIFTYLKKQYQDLSVSGVFYAMNGHYPWHHYAGEAGFNVLGSEIGENINNYQIHIALNRGAARQYQTPWFIDFSMWHGPSILYYRTSQIWGKYSGADNGHSLSLFERSMLMSYMAGADSLVAEAGNIIAFDDNGDLTPYGEICKKLYTFTQTYADVGTSYTPFALVLDYYHGMYSGFDGKKAFYTFPYESGDQFTWDVVNTIWPGGWEIQQGGDENNLMMNGSYGDLFDMVMQNTSYDLLSTYRALILTGGTVLSNSQRADYLKYVVNGGMLVLNTAYLTQFPDCGLTAPDGTQAYTEIAYGKGTFLVFGDDYDAAKMGAILKDLETRFLPFNVEGNIEYLCNIKSGSLIITLINNNGVLKYPTKPTKIDESQSTNVRITVNGGYTASFARDIYNEADLAVADNTVSLTIPAGGISVIAFQID